MKDAFGYRIPDGRTLADVLFAPLDAQHLTPTVVDVGARNGMFLIPRGYAQKAHFIGFEPNPEEYEKLIQRNTDAMKAGFRMAKFKSEQYYDCALWREEGTFPFYITQGPGACTMMGASDPSVMKRVWLENDPQSFEDKHSHVVKTTQIKCRRLDSLLPAGTIIDFLKIDVEGADTAVLEGSEGLLKAGGVLFVLAEFQLFPFYKNHQIFGDLQVLLNRHGYRLIGIDSNHGPYTRDRSLIPSYADRRLLYSGDAYFIRDPDRSNLSPLEKHQTALVCLVLGFNSLAISLLRDAALVPAATLTEIEQVFAKHYLQKRLRSIWNRVPTYILQRATKLKQALS